MQFFKETAYQNFQTHYFESYFKLSKIYSKKFQSDILKGKIYILHPYNSKCSMLEIESHNFLKIVSYAALFFYKELQIMYILF